MGNVLGETKELTQYAVVRVAYSGIWFDMAKSMDEVEAIVAEKRLSQSRYGIDWVVMQPIGRKVSYQGGYTLPEPVKHPEPEEENA